MDDFDRLAAWGAIRFAPGSPCCHTLHRSDLRGQCATLTPYWYKTSGNPSWYMMKGGDLYELAKILGHANIKMTERYAKLGRAHIARTTNVAREIWSLIEPERELQQAN
jgi:integrase